MKNIWTRRDRDVWVCDNGNYIRFEPTQWSAKQTKNWVAYNAIARPLRARPAKNKKAQLRRFRTAKGAMKALDLIYLHIP